MTDRIYRPSNGTEGDMFRSRFCFQCERDRAFQEDEGEGCGIIVLTMIHEPSDPEYPREWTYDSEGNPTCTAFVPLGSPLPTERELEAAGQQVLFEDCTPREAA